MNCTPFASSGNIKATRTSVGELRKETALPRRFEQASEYQEKLRQLYHIYHLTNRLNALARTLDFFSHDILHPTPAPAQEDESSNRKTSNPYRALLHLPTRDLHSLGLHASSFDPFILTTPTPASRTSKDYFPLLESDDKDSPFSSSSSDIAHRRVFVTSVVARIEAAEAEGRSASSQTLSSPPLGLNNVNLSAALMSWASHLCSTLEETKRRRESHIQAMYAPLEPLWQRLKVDQEDMDVFVDMNRGSTEECVRAYEDELERMLELKRERMGDFIQRTRGQIFRLCDELMTGEEERGASGAFMDELFGIHEDEIQKLQEEKRLKAP
ncbi:hypothetical protein D9758_010716 [Tetrapyrgos nigripes]|uniref:Uncharacterized protein n=1 Tax=Tetrapyrgos nigripes TaxID=182062 RepID=A0A8H5GG46_9AGAR|nr:hypothetical protein D9758_010716 [Tetrapyrgos nigripes]